MNAHDLLSPDCPPGELGDTQQTVESGQGKAHRCHICNRSYERRDHLSRHVKSHNEQRSHVCQDCGKGFHRGDLLTRHRVVHLKDASAENLRRRTTKACQSCIAAKTKCTEQRPCARCIARNEPCVPTQARVRNLDSRDSTSGVARSSEPDLTASGGMKAIAADKHDDGLMAFQDAASFGAGDGFDDFQFPDFFDQIMNMPTVQSNDLHETLQAPPNVSNFGFISDDFGMVDYDFRLLASGLTRPPTAQGMRPETDTNDLTQDTPQSDAQLRSEAFEKSPWGWNQWIPNKNNHTFSGQEINVTEQRVNADDQLTPGDRPRLFFSLELEARDRILRLVTSVAASRLKYLRFITGRHDLPFYYSEEVELQRSFLDAFLKGKDEAGWSEKGKLPPVSVVLRKGDVGFNDARAEKAYPRRSEHEWPIARTKYTNYHLTPDASLSTKSPQLSDQVQTISWKALGKLDEPQLVQFITSPFESETEITGHIVARLCVSASKAEGLAQAPSDIDLFLTLRHVSPEGKEVFYTGTAGDPVPLTKGWLRVSLRKVEPDHPYHKEWLPHREYRSSDVQEVKPETVHEVDIELWPTNVVVEKGGKLVLEVSSGDTQGSGIFGHNSFQDRPEDIFAGRNHIHFSKDHQNYVTLPVIPPAEN